uniref:PX domain-containing protein n=1 Tax=Ciona savignyi TaxID=51511 RepID=H2YB12_CIOSA
MYDVMESRDLRIPENMHKEYIHILVSNPTIHNTHENGRYTTYQVSLKTNSPSFSLKYSVVDRRYSDFTWLRRVLARTTDVKPPNLPFGGIIGTFTKRYLDERQTILTEFLRKVVRQTLYLSNSALHLFLQTRLAKKEMDGMLKDARRRGSMNCIRKAVALHGPVYPPVSNKEPVDYASSDFPLSSRDSSVIRSSGSFGSFRDDSDTSSDALSCTNSIQNQQNNNLKVEESDWVIIDLDESQVDDEKAIEFTAYTDITWSSPSDVDISCLNSPGSSDVSVCDSFPLKSHIIDIKHRGSVGGEVAQSSSLGTL